MRIANLSGRLAVPHCEPPVFTKLPSCITGPDADIALPAGGPHQPHRGYRGVAAPLRDAPEPSGVTMTGHCPGQGREGHRWLCTV